jgi:hypothetical protein
MRPTRLLTSLTALLASASFLCSGAQATTFNGTAYYTDYAATTVSDVTYSYNDVTHVFTTGAPSLVATLPGADGIVFAPNGNLLVGGQGSNQVYNVLPSTGTYTTASAGNSSYHLTLAPNGLSVYTAPFGGPLANVPLSNFGTANAPTITNVTGNDGGVTQIAFAGSKTFYVNGQPNCCGNVGTIDLTTGVTTRLASGVAAAHGIIYDSYSGLIDLFGEGYVATINPNTLAVSASSYINGANFDQGAPDGFGHALIAGSGGLTFIDYSGSGSILAPNYETFVSGFGNIDDIAPLSGIGSQTGNTPIPATLPLFASGLGALGLLARRKKRKVAAALAAA